MTKELKIKHLEEPFSFDGGNTYMLALKTKSIKSLGNLSNCFRNCKIIRLKLDGIGQTFYSMEPILIPELGISIHNKQHKHIRFECIIRSDNIDLKRVKEILFKYKPKTLYVKEMEIKTDEGTILEFLPKQFREESIRNIIERSHDVQDTTLFLNRIWDIETLSKIRKKYLGRTLSFILKGSGSIENVMKYEVVGNGKEGN